VCSVFIDVCVCVLRKKRQNAVNNKLLLQKKKMPQEKSCQTQFLWGVILGNMFQVKRPLLQFKNTFEWIISMVYLMLFK